MANTNTNTESKTTLRDRIANETLKSSGRAGLEVAAVAVSLTVLVAKTAAAEWHNTKIGGASRTNDLASTIRHEGDTAKVLNEYAEDFVGLFKSDKKDDAAPLAG